MNVPVRLATADDADAVCAIDAPVGDIRRRRTFIERAIAASECHVAVDGGAIVGFVVFHRSLYEQPFISLLVVDGSQRRRGIGATLMRHIESICPEEKLFTSTNESNALMRRLCEKLGFVQSGHIENLDDGDPEIVYFKRLREKNRE